MKEKMVMETRLVEKYTALHSVIAIAKISKCAMAIRFQVRRMFLVRS